jgi:alkanesulfonate monooxygenase SsuD/methylene tetrahydromethanopterin reductase-like flavin-dependent oxidoreductase (luciferase family)
VDTTTVGRAGFRHPVRVGVAGQGPITEAARRAESSGYDALLVGDHTGMLAPLPTLAAAAAVTDRIRLGVQTINIAFRPLAALAQEAAAIDVISGGRLLLGLGAGYAEQEVRSMGLPHLFYRFRWPQPRLRPGGGPPGMTGRIIRPMG